MTFYQTSKHKVEFTIEEELYLYGSRMREPDLAMCHVIDVPWEGSFDDLEDDPKFIQEVERELSALWDLRRGDMVFIKSFLDKYNEGKMIYDGKHVISLEYYDGYRGIPREFQAIVEFPPSYWNGLIRADSYPFVPFDFPTHIPNPDVNELEGDFKMWVYPMIGVHNEIYAIVSNPRVMMTREEFIQALSSTKYYYVPTYKCNAGSHINQENIIMLPDDDAYGVLSPFSSDNEA